MKCEQGYEGSGFSDFRCDDGLFVWMGLDGWIPLELT